MENTEYWSVYDCEIVDLKVGPEADSSLPRAIRYDRGHPLKKAIALPRGFVTKVLLDYDFSDDNDVLSFVRDYGPVMCPYAGAISRTLAAIEEPFSYRRLLNSVVSDSKDEPRGAGAFVRLFGVLRERFVHRGGRPLDASEDYMGCDYVWDAKRLFYSGMNASAESDYLRTERRGFVRYLEDDNRLVGTERLRALAWNRAAGERRETGIWDPPQCLVSLEETRGTLYLLQVAAVVLQGFSYIDFTVGERHNAGIQRRRYVKALQPKSFDGVDEEEARKIRWASNHVGGMQLDIRRVERIFDLFIMGRPNLIKALLAVCPDSLERFDGPHARPGLPDGILSSSEVVRVEGTVAKARELHAGDAQTLRLLELRPQWQAWSLLQEDLAIFLEACLTNCWDVGSHHLVETDVLRVGGLEEGGALFGGSADRMTLQKAIAEQIVENLELASKKLHESRQDGGEDRPSWQVCSECGNLYMARSKSRRLILLGEEEPKRVKLPTATTCSEACRMAEKRAKG